MFHEWSMQLGQTPGGPGPQPEAEELWEREMEWLRASQEPLRLLPYAMVDKRFIRQMREPEDMEMTCWQQWQRRQQTMAHRLREAAWRLARGFGLWEGALYEIGGRSLTSHVPSLESCCPAWKGRRAPSHPHRPAPPSWHIRSPRSLVPTSLGDSTPWWPSEALPEHGGRWAPTPGGSGSPSSGPDCSPHSLAFFTGLFGSGIRSYFTFLRFLLLLNLLTVLLTANFVLVPLAWLHPPGPSPAPNFTLQCPRGHQPQTDVPRFHNRLWNVLTGRAFNNTYLFYGAYRAGPESSSAYSIRLAYLLCPLACLMLCFCGTLRRMVKGLPQRPGLGQAYRVPLSAKVFSSWDFCIHVREAATIKKHEISNEFKGYLEESHRLRGAQRETPAQRACRLLSYLRINVLMGLLVAGGISAIFWATKYSQDNKEEPLFLVLQYLPPGVISLVNFLGPMVFVFLVQLENYPPSTEVNLTLIWCVVLKLASLGMFSFSLGQTMLCIGRNKTSCEAYGYNACDYQCWENSVGEELYKLIIFNFLLTVAFAFLVSLPRRLLVERFSGRFWTWLDREEFLVPKNVLDIVAGQAVTWMGLFYCPLLPLFHSIFLFLTFYIKKLVLLLGLLLAAAPLGYVVSSTHSSWDCGLFSNYSAPWQVVQELVALRLPVPGQRVLHYLGSHAFSFPLLILLRCLSGWQGPWEGNAEEGVLFPSPSHGAQKICREAQPCPDRVRLPVPGQCESHPRAPEAVGVAGPGEVAPGGGAVAAAARARLERISDPRLPSLPSFAPKVLWPRIPEPRFPGPQAGTLPHGPSLIRLLLPRIARCPGPAPHAAFPTARARSCSCRWL
ncbi:transmembrane channel-like protein 8 isoform X2 [Heterocephalus glaber]|uniref:Transmembrane channel-like protein n=1 Tax=Heterocephalus glaber TaxID=10181 RepID=A0AAX6RIA5_HETGA|nr:transmembrane channel-like protein 8 isoform X2 [Heterocephalus glaber]